MKISRCIAAIVLANHMMRTIHGLPVLIEPIVYRIIITPAIVINRGWNMGEFVEHDLLPRLS